MVVAERRLIARPRLLAQLDGAVERPLTVICAPPGSGTRTLLRQWQHHANGRRTVWLSPPPPSASTAGWTLDTLRDATADLGDAVAIVDGLDPLLHHEAVDWLRGQARQRARRAHVIVRPPIRWPVRAEERSRELVSVLTRADLRFTPKEGEQLLDLLVGRVAAGASGQELVERCMGWAAALRIAALGAARSPDPVAGLAAFRCDDPYLVAFVEQEILAPLSSAMVRFLVRSSVLQQLSGSLCGATTGELGSTVMLRLVERRGLFIDRVSGSDAAHSDEARYEFEPAFRELLLAVLRQREPGVEGDLHSRAARWHRVRGDAVAAADQLILAGGWDELLDLVDVHGGEFFEQRRGSELLRWLDAVPYGNDHPRWSELQLRRGFVLTMQGRSQQAAHVIGSLDPAYEASAQSVIADVLRSNWGYFHASPSSVIRAAESVLERLALIDDETLPNLFGVLSRHDLQLMAGIQRARAMWYDGDVAASDAAFTPLLEIEDVYPPWRVHLLGASALLRAWTGDLVVAERRASQALALARTVGVLRHAASLDARLAIACVARERGEVVRAARALQAAAEAGAQNRPITMVLYLLERSLLSLSAGRPGEGLEELRAVHEHPVPRGLADRLRAAEVRLNLAAGDVGRARWLVAQEPGSPLLQGPGVHCDATVGDLGSVRRRLAAWQPHPLERREQVERGMWSAYVEFVDGSRRRGLRSAAAVLDTAEAEGLVQVLLDPGVPFARLLRSLQHTEPRAFLRALLERSSAATASASGYRTVGLSQREVEILRRLPSPVSNDEVAQQLFISVNTLKTHLRAIYRKLGVHSRREAVRRAEELGWM
jgi:LuxR family transcriptional regulator, maltose regulon positive regulatory protein